MKTILLRFQPHGKFLRPRTSVARLLACLFFMASSCALLAQAKAPKQVNDEEYTKKIKEYLSDPRFSTELVDHLPASSKVPTPLKFLGTMPGQPGELYYNADINRYYEELAKDSPRAKFWKLALKSEEGRDMVVLAIGSEESIKAAARPANSSACGPSFRSPPTKTTSAPRSPVAPVGEAAGPERGAKSTSTNSVIKIPSAHPRVRPASQF